MHHSGMSINITYHNQGKIVLFFIQKNSSSQQAERLTLPTFSPSTNKYVVAKWTSNACVSLDDDIRPIS